MKRPPLQSFRAENFKAIRDSGRVEFGWLTAFIGNNGTGKSSLVEAIETFRDVVLDGVDSAFRRWRGFEHVWNKAPKRKLLERVGHRPCYSHPLSFRSEWNAQAWRWTLEQTINEGPGGNSLFIQQEQLIRRHKGGSERWMRSEDGQLQLQDDGSGMPRADLVGDRRFADGDSSLKTTCWPLLESLQFLLLNPERLGQPTAQQRATSAVRLAKDGANLAEYLNEIRQLDLPAFESLLEALRFVVPYAVDLQPTLTSELERTFYLKMKEQTYEIPGWLLSTGTLRIVALLACLRHPKPPRVLIVEEIENGLDPRTLNLLVEEIRSAITARTTQIILTTHSPYLLDLLDLSHIVIVEREEGQPVFRRPDAKQLAQWAKSFSPGQLYTMGRLTQGET